MKHGKKRRYKSRNVIIILTLLIVVFAFEWYHVYRNVFLKAAYPQKYLKLVTQNAKINKLDPFLVYAVIRSESSFDPQAKSNIGAMGLMQLTPPTFEWAMDKTPEKEIYTSADLYTPNINIRYGTIVLSAFLAEFGNEETAIAAYNAGRGNVKKWLADPRYSKDGKTLTAIPFAETRDYVIKVEQSKKIYTELYDNSNREN